MAEMKNSDESVSPELAAALRRLRWVVPGRDYDNRLIADVQEVLRHFGMYPYVAGDQPCNCTPDGCNGEGYEPDDPRTCRICLNLDGEMPCPAEVKNIDGKSP